MHIENYRICRILTMMYVCEEYTHVRKMTYFLKFSDVTVPSFHMSRERTLVLRCHKVLENITENTEMLMRVQINKPFTEYIKL